jgi:hypothetical protein
MDLNELKEEITDKIMSELTEAYISKEDKARLYANIRKVLKKYGMRGTMSVRDLSVLTVTINSGKLDLEAYFTARGRGKNLLEPRGIEFSPAYEENLIDDEDKPRFKKILDFFKEMDAAMKGEDYYDRSDRHHDYVDVSHYHYISIGQKKPYKKL